MSKKKYTKAEDRIGRTFGQLTVLSVRRGKGSIAYAQCACSCGSAKEYILSRVVVGKTSSCGCLRERVLDNNYLNKTYNSLKIIKILDLRARKEGSKKKYRYCRALCLACGKEVERDLHSITTPSSSVITCGCVHGRTHGEATGPGSSPSYLYTLWSRCKSVASNKGVPFLEEWNTYPPFKAYVESSGLRQELGKEGKLLVLLEHDKGYVPGNLKAGDHFDKLDREAFRTTNTSGVTYIGRQGTQEGWFFEIKRKGVRTRVKLDTFDEAMRFRHMHLIRIGEDPYKGISPEILKAYYPEESDG